MSSFNPADYYRAPQQHAPGEAERVPSPATTAQGSWRMLLAVVLAGICSFIDLYATQALLPYLRHVFSATEIQVSLTIGASTIAVALSAPLWGLLADATGRKRVIVSAIFGLAVPTFLAAHSGGLNELIFWRFAQGLFLPGIFAITIAYITEEAPEGRVGWTMAVYVSGTVVGGFMGRFLSGIMAAHFGWHSAFLLLGSINLVGGIVVWICLPRSRRFVRQRNLGASLRSFTAHLRNPRLLATYAVGFNVLFSLVGTFTYVGFYLAAPPFHLNTVALSSIFFVYMLGVVVTPLAGRLIDRFGYRTMLAAAVCASAGGVLLTLWPVLPAVVAGLAICSSGVFVCQSAASSHIGVAAQGARSSAAGLYVSLYYFGGTAGSVLPGLLWRIGGWPACVALIVALQILTACMALVFWAEPPTDDEAAAMSVSHG